MRGDGVSGAPVPAGPTTTRIRLAVRTVLAAFGFVQLVNGLWALLAPHSFYSQFPFGRGWVEMLPAYNDHLVRDVGGLFLATAGLLLGAAIVMTRAAVVIACVSWLMYALPHAVYHAFNLGPFGTGDAIANAIVLSSAVLLPAWVLVAVARRQPVHDARRQMVRSTSGGRIEGVPDGTRNLLIRAGFRESRRRYGAVMEPLRVFAHHPKLMVGYAALEMASERSNRVSARLKHLADLRPARELVALQDDVALQVEHRDHVAEPDVGAVEEVLRLPLGVAVAITFIGPLTIAVFGSRRPQDIVWALLARGGVYRAPVAAV